MRCFTSLVLGLLALEVALAQNRQENVFNLVQSLCSKASISESTECINNQDEKCAQNPMCCSGSCISTCKTSINTDVPKAGCCSWNPRLVIPNERNPESLCSRNSDCPDNMKCCSFGCAVRCDIPRAGSFLCSAKMAPAGKRRAAWTPAGSAQQPRFRRRGDDVRSAPVRVEAVR
ncbi:whey acidic protein-like [Meriones unguiculatus]|uniref:whey acidic protein-like n=1 Tax=Meriones unguiculatus TaxID=10047 RepID=UPI000B4EE28B|nr:whey acidic protein-like [Meriones unguiculatus]